MLQVVFGALQPAGLAPAAPARDDSRFSLDHWHGEVIRLMEENDGSLEDLGRFWDQLATETFAANMQQPLWGWADPRSAWLLDYWVDYEPRLFFLLLYSSPAETLASLMVSDTPADQLQAQLQTWEDQHRAMLHAFHSHPRRCLLVSASEALANPQALATQLVDRCGLPLNPAAVAQPRSTPPDALASYLAEQLLADYPELAALHRELQASALPLTASGAAGSPQVIDSTNIVASYRQLRDRSAEQASVALAREQFDRLNQQLQRNLGSYQDQYQAFQARLRAAEDQAQLANQQSQALKGELDKLRQAHQQQIGALQSELDKLRLTHKEQTEESDLLLTQLHQVQEELEAIFLQHEATKKAAAEKEAVLQNQQAQAHKARDEQSRLATERQQQLDALQKQLATLTQARDSQTKLVAERQQQLEAQTKLATERQQQLDALQKQLATLTQARDQQTKLATERQTQLDQLTKARDAQTKLATERQQQLEAQTKLATERQQQLDKSSKELAALQAQLKAAKENQAAAQALKDLQQQLKESQEENDLLLTQLHQVQEELETWFLKHQGSDKKLQELNKRNDLQLMQMHQMQDELGRLFETDQQLRQQLRESDERWQALLQRHPAYAHVGSLQWLKQDKQGATHWRLRDVSTAGRSFAALEFCTILHSSGMAGIGFTCNKQGKSPLLRWPAQIKDDTLWLVPAGDKQQLRNATALLVELGTSDWLMLKALLGKLQEALTQAPPAELADAAALCNGLARLSQLMQSLAVLRYDQLQLKREQVNPDYEHLWLQFSNFSWGDQLWPGFEFRLSCAQVTPSSFGLFPKLEFPQEGGKAPFNNWFLEAEDDFGAKLELRYNLPESLDVVVWGKLDARDKEFIALLVQHLLLFLGQLEASGTKLERSWQDWQRMVLLMQEVTARFMAPSAPLEAPVASELGAAGATAAVQALSASTKVGKVAPKAVAPAPVKAKAKLKAQTKPGAKSKKARRA